MRKRKFAALHHRSAKCLLFLVQVVGRPGTARTQVHPEIIKIAARIGFNIISEDDDADVRQAAEAFYGLMTDFKFLPNSPTLMNAGKAWTTGDFDLFPAGAGQISDTVSARSPTKS